MLATTLCSIAVFLLIFLVYVFRSMVQVVPQGEQWTVERFGRFTRVLRPGLNLLLPFIHRVSVCINMRERVLDVPQQNVITQDNAMVRVDGVVFFRILDPAKAAYEVDDLEDAMVNIVLTSMRTVIGGMMLDQTLSKREIINATLLVIIDEATDPWGVKVNRVEIKEIMPSDDLLQSMERQTKAAREKRAAVLEAEGFQQAIVLKAEGEKKAMILGSEARVVVAQAEARAIEVVSKSITKGNPQAPNYFVAQQYMEAIKHIGQGNNGKVIFLPQEASGVMATIAGIGHLAKETFSK